jgi:hypothetical protein
MSKKNTKHPSSKQRATVAKAEEAATKEVARLTFAYMLNDFAMVECMFEDAIDLAYGVLRTVEGAANDDMHGKMAERMLRKAQVQVRKALRTARANIK